MEKDNKYSLTDDQGNLVRVSSHGPSIEDIEIEPLKKVKKEKVKSKIKFVFLQVNEDNKKKKNSRNLYFFGQLKKISFFYNERRYSKNIHVEIRMEKTAALDVMSKFKKASYMCSKIILPGEKRLTKNTPIKKSSLKRIKEFTIIRIFGDYATVKVTVAQ